MDYFEKYSGRFPLRHLKDTNMTKGESTEFGKGGSNIPLIMQNIGKSGVEHIFIEQEECTVALWESMEHNMMYLSKL
ncbi:hypothetical protein [Maribacter sp. 2304DJ31-5]|uniref:hypothetical protein n=1 Tax=Maribacter sp. 2304DJ31-5 TaxID=3386273 RepID=UPI0039BD343A